MARRALGLDLGSSSVRAIVFEQAGDGSVVQVEGASARRPRRLDLSQPGQATFNADSYFGDLVACLDELHERDLLQGVTDIGVDSQWHSVLPLDASGRPLCDVLSWADTRAHFYRPSAPPPGDQRLEALRQRTGCAYAALYWTRKVPWLFDVGGAAGAASVVGLPEYVYLQLVGEMSTSVSMASGTGLLDTGTLDWDSEALELAGLNRAKLPPLAAADWLGQLASDWQRRWPELARAPWHPVLGDGAAANLGAGCDRPGLAAITVGTSAAVRAVRRTPDTNELPRGLWRYVVDHERVVLGAAYSSGGQLCRWALELREATDPLGYQVEMPVPAGSEGVGVLPWHSGTRPPAKEVPAQEGVVFGLGLGHTGAHIVSAAAEAVCFELAGGLADLEAGGTESNLPTSKGVAGGRGGADGRLEVIAGGGALEGVPWWKHRLAAALGRRVLLAAEPETSARGAAGMAVGAGGGPARGEWVEPDPAEVAALSEARRRWEHWRDALLPLASVRA